MTGDVRLPTIAVRAPAKINLTLCVLGVRYDGFHEVRTTYQSLALHDELTITPRPGPFAIECDDPRCPSDRTNLVWRAADRLWRASGRRGRAHGALVRITKRIPIEAGLGGGSSDAAAALRALARLWNIDVGIDRLRRLAGELGADVPFFLDGGTALGVDRGDLLFQLIDRPSAWVVLVVPDVRVSTRNAYGWWDEQATADQTIGASRHRVGNDLQRAVVRRHPEVARAVRGLRRAGASYAAMSGSGSAVFGLFAVRKAADLAAAGLRDLTGRTLITETVSRARYRRLTELRVKAS